MKHLLLTTIAAVLLVECGESQQSVPSPETKPVEPVAEAAKPEPTTAKAPDIDIHEAVETGNIEAVKQAIAGGADVNAKDGDGGTPLHMAAANGHKEIAELLIVKGADVNAKAVVGSTPLDFANDCDTEGETADLLRKHGGSHGYLGHEFVMSILENRKPQVDIGQALNMTVAGVVAHQSAIKDGELMKIPQYAL